MTSKAARWRRAVAAAVGGVLVATAAACGVPSSGKPVVDGAVNPNGSPGGGGQSEGPPSPSAFDASATPIQFVEGYLAALGALPPTATTDDEIATAQAWIKVSSCQPKVSPCGAWHPSSPITVIRAPVDDWTSTHVGLGAKVSGVAQIIGTFSPATGLLQPPGPANSTTLPLEFSVQPDPSGTSGYWRLENAPPFLLISEDAMSTWYTAHAVYFWNADHTALIPDIHYLSSTLGNPGSLREATQIINWVLEGDSSPWLGLSGSIAPGVVLKDPTVKVAGGNANRFVVNLSANARGLDHADLLASQLRWSLGNITATPRGSWPSEVELQVDGQELTTSDLNNYRNDVLNLKPPRAYPAAASFAIMGASATSGGSVTEFEIGQTSARTVELVPKESQPPVLNSQLNSGVLLAAVDGYRTAAALVRRNARTGAAELWVRWLKGDPSTDFQQVRGLPAGVMLRPQFIVQPNSDQTTTAVCVVSVAGKLYTVSPGGGAPVARKIATQNVGAISAFSIAPDAHRIAYVSGGKLYVSVLQNSGGALALAQGNEINTAPGTRQIPDLRPVGLDTVTHVVWSSVSTLLVVGRRGQRSVVEQMSVDGSSAYDFDKDYGTSTIEQLAWYVYDPMRPAPTGYSNLLLQILGNPGNTGSSADQIPLKVVLSGRVVNLFNPFFQD